MMKIMTLEDIVSHNAQEVTDFMNKTSKNFRTVGKIVMLMDFALLIMCYGAYKQDKEIESIKKDIRNLKAAQTLDEAEFRQYKKDQAEKEK